MDISVVTKTSAGRIKFITKMSRTRLKVRVYRKLRNYVSPETQLANYTGISLTNQLLNRKKETADI